jgi:hypothetical protein
MVGGEFFNLGSVEICVFWPANDSFSVNSAYCFCCALSGLQKPRLIGLRARKQHFSYFLAPRSLLIDAKVNSAQFRLSLVSRQGKPHWLAVKKAVLFSSSLLVKPPFSAQNPLNFNRT